MLKFEETDWERGYKVQSLPKEVRRTDPLGQSNETSYQRAHHLQNFHDKGYETSITRTNNDPFDNTNHHRKQHFIRGVVPGGSGSNKMIYGTSELLRQEEERKKLAKATETKPAGFLYGTEAATKVGKPNPTTRPNNALWLEQRVHDDHVSRHKYNANEQDDFIKRHKQEKMRQALEAQQEKKKDLEMLRSFEPWGKQGGGAPLSKGSGPNKWEARRTKAVTSLKEEEYTPFGLGGGGAPNRTASGKQMTQLRGDPELRFPTYGQNGDVAPCLRYKKDREYGRDLENIMDEARARKELQRKQSYEQELRHINQDLFGKPGAGAPMKDSRGEVKAYYPTTLSKDMEELRSLEPRHPHAYNNTQNSKSSERTWLDPDEYDPWGKGTGTVQRTISGKVIKPHKPNTDDATDGIGIPIGRPGAGAPIKDNDGKLKTRKPQTLTKNNYGQVMSRDFSPKERRGEVYDPFGKPGAGAPIRDADGRVKTQLIAQVEHDGMDYVPSTTWNDVQAKQAHLKTLQDLKEQADSKRKAEREELKKSGDDVASWIKGGVVGQPKFDPVTKEIVASHRATSDVTQQKLNIRRQKNESSSNYHHDLQLQIETKQQQKSQEKAHEIQDSLKHVSTMSQQWGKPGAGAPLNGYRKQKVGLAPVDEMSFLQR